MTQIRDDALSLLIRATHEDGSPLDDREMRDEVLTMIMAGYETTTSGPGVGFRAPAPSPGQARAAASMSWRPGTRLPGRRRQGDPRRRPVVPVVARKALSADRAEAATDLPAGSVLMVSIYLVHSDPETYPDPKSIRARAIPERWKGTEGGSLDSLRRRRPALSRRGSPSSR